MASWIKSTTNAWSAERFLSASCIHRMPDDSIQKLSAVDHWPNLVVVEGNTPGKPLNYWIKNTIKILLDQMKRSLT